MNRSADDIEQIDRDLRDVAAQLDAGELDAATADRLRASYERERAALLESAATEPGAPQARSGRRTLVGGAILALGVVAVVVSGVWSLQDDNAAEGVTDGVATGVFEGNTGADLESVSNEEMEAVIAANPTVIGMRLALAERYVEAGDHSSALDHYLAVLDQEPNQPEALAMVGWLTYLAGEAELAEPFVIKALESEPSYPLALWFLANIRITNSDLDGAGQALERLLTYDIGPEVRAEAEGLLDFISRAGDLSQ